MAACICRDNEECQADFMDISNSARGAGHLAAQWRWRTFDTAVLVVFQERRAQQIVEFAAENSAVTALTGKGTLAATGVHCPP